MKKLSRLISLCLGCWLIVLGFAAPASALNTLLSYQQYPPVITLPTKPNVLIMMSNDWTGFTEGYHGDYDNSIDYWGYFDPRKEYSYAGSKFTPKGKTPTTVDATGEVIASHYTTNNSYWSGNFLNWATMSHADFLRKAITGGERGNDTPFGTTLTRADIPDSTDWKKPCFHPDLAKFVPSGFASSGNEFYVVGTEMQVLVRAELQQTVNKKGKVTITPPLGTFNAVVEVCPVAYPEGNCAEYYDNSGNLSALKPEGLLQKYLTEMKFGLMSYSYGKDDQGGVVRFQIKDLSTDSIINDKGGFNQGDNMINFINKYTKKGWDPLAEMFYDGVRYLRGNSYGQAAYCPAVSESPVEGCKSGLEWVDPVQSWCQKNSIIIINDEYPSRDHDSIPHSAFNPTYEDTPKLTEPSRIPASMQTYNPDVVALLDTITKLEGLDNTQQLMGPKNGSSGTSCTTAQTVDNLANFSGICPKEKTSNGTFHLAALAFDAFSNDMRLDLKGKQSFRTYGIAFRATSGVYEVPPPPLNQMYLAGKYGNFDDVNGTNTPDLEEEWMKSSVLCAEYPDSKNCLPKGFFYAEGGDAIEAAIIEVFESILRRSASGTSVSVLATSGQGEGNLVQAYYRPARSEATVDGARDVVYTGYLQSLWVDKYGNLREDTVQDGKLDVTADKIIKYIEENFETKIARYPVSSSVPYPDSTGISTDVVPLDQIRTVWEAGKVLTDTDSVDRTIYTGIDKNFDGKVVSTERVPFTLSETSIHPYLALQDSATENGNGYLGKLEDARIKNLIAFIRGDDPREGKLPSRFEDPAFLDLRDRRINIKDGAVTTAKVWKLGDIVNSTPISLSSPPDRFDLIYSDPTYGAFYQLYKNRETMIYVGANDGMLHAFTSWRYNKSTQEFENPDVQDTSLADLPIGSEVWAYIPQSLLPHLKWLANPDYTHVFYMDMQPRIFDARIFPVDAAHPYGWGTVMVVGMNTGGGLTTIPVDLNSDGSYDQLNPSYMAFDITEPRNPVLLWEKSYKGLGFSRSMPTVIRIGPKSDKGDWYMVFGNGPDSGNLSAGTDPNYKGESITNGRIYIVDVATGSPFTGDDANTEWWKQVADQKAFFNTPNTFDWGNNHNVDAAYLATTYNSSGSPAVWKGSVYRILTQASPTPTYQTDPNSWSLNKIFNSPRPITAQGALSTDGLGNVWAYYGTGRYLDNGEFGDKISIEQEYILGIKDPFFNKNYDTATTGYYHDISKNKVLEVAYLMEATPVVVLNTGAVFCYNGTSYSSPNLNITTSFDPATSQPCVGSGSNGTFNDLLRFAQKKDGWIRKLETDPNNPTDPTDEDAVASERNLNRPAVFGGLTYFTTFSPTGDECSYGGKSTLWAPYYETGTAYKRATFTGATGLELLTDGSGRKRIVESFDLGSGAASAIGFHLGVGEDGKSKVDGFVQMGSGAILKVPDVDPPSSIGSGLRSWIERGD